jgi:Na+-translocating ferredoxin:NAD+ oxidoreductase RnfD subunit
MTFFRDPRDYQISVLGGLLVYGFLALDFDVNFTQVAVTLTSLLLIQYACTRLWRLPRFDPKSALISGLSLCLLLRTNFMWLVPVAALITIASKFVLRVNGKHVFNPTNFGIVILLLTTNMAWVSPGQWGNVAFFGFLMACLGGLVVHRALRSDVAIAFALFYAGLLLGRSYYLGEPMAIPIHRLQSGALLLFTFFMISDPRTTPDTRAGRIIFAALVAFGAWYVQFRMFRTNGLLWSLVACSLLTPIIDWLMPGNRYQWNTSPRKDDGGMSVWKRMTGVTVNSAVKPAVLAIAALGLLGPGFGPGFGATNVEAFCGFYVSKADTKIFNKASKVVIARDGDRTIMTMANDFKGEMKEFAVVIPVPTMIQRDQIHVGEQAVIDHLDAFTAPRLVEYFDEDPCNRRMYEMSAQAAGGAPRALPAPAAADRAKSLGVTIEATYTVGEYDIMILSAKQSGGLETWLRESGYRIPNGATEVLGSYIKQNMRFFVAKVNLKEQGKLGFNYLRPLQVAYESPKFMLPIRLGTVNADGAQELFVMALTRKGRVETTNYRTVRLPTGMDVPVYVKGEFAKFYTAMFDAQVKRENMSVVFLEYAWDMGWCDPCAADPLTEDELKKLGVFWLDGPPAPAAAQPGGANPMARRPMPMPRPRGAGDVFVTRLHVRYDGTTFPEDLVFQETTDRANFQGRYVLRHAFTGNSTCDAMTAYKKDLTQRWEREAQTLANLTGWAIADIRKKMGGSAPPPPAADDSAWWRRIWK